MEQISLSDFLIFNFSLSILLVSMRMTLAAARMRSRGLRLATPPASVCFWPDLEGRVASSSPVSFFFGSAIANILNEPSVHPTSKDHEVEFRHETSFMIHRLATRVASIRRKSLTVCLNKQVTSVKKKF